MERGERQGIVLVVDPDERARDDVCRSLEAGGFPARGAASSDEALRLLAEGWAPRLILLDVMASGAARSDFRSAQWQDPRVADVPVVFLTSFDHGANVGEGLGAAVLAKTASPEHLLRVVAAKIGSP